MNGFGGNIKTKGDTVWNGIIMVDEVNGNDLTGQRNVINKPFKTIQAAHAVYENGDLIDVLSGTYNFAAPLSVTQDVGVPEKHFNFRDGAIVFGNFSGALFAVAGTPTTNLLHIYGRGEFINESITNFGGSSITSGPAEIYGAKKIVSGQSGIGTGPSFMFGTTNNSGVYQDIDELINWKTNGAIFSFATQLIDDEWKGIIRNCKKVGDITSFAIPFGLSATGDDSLFVENCNFYSNNYCITQPAGDMTVVIQNCIFKSTTGRVGIVNKYSEWYNCHFVNEGTNDTILVLNSQFETDGQMPLFQNCSFRNNGTGRAVRTLDGAIWQGVNRLYTEGVESAYGAAGNISKNYGTIIAKVMDSLQAPQSWYFTLNTDVPTSGDTFTITSPDLSTISYIVQPGDTRTEIVNGLVAAWDADVVSNPFGFFAKFDNKIVQTGPTWRIIVTAIDENDNVPSIPGFELSTDGSDSILTQQVEAAQFPWKGTGKFITDENLIVPNY